MIRLDAGEAGQIEVNLATRAAFRDYYDSMARGGSIDAANINLWAACAVSPSPAELESFIQDFDMLPVMIAAEIARAAGYDLGGDGYPMLDVPDEIQAKSRRKVLGFRTPAGDWYLRPNGGGGAYGEDLARFAAGAEGSSRYEALRSLVLARALSPDAATLATAIEQYPGIPVVLEDRLVEAAGTGGKALVRL